MHFKCVALFLPGGKNAEKSSVSPWLSITGAVYTNGLMFLSFRDEPEKKFHLKCEQGIEGYFESEELLVSYFPNTHFK